MANRKNNQIERTNAMKIKKALSSTKYIDLKEGNNKPLIIGIIASIVILSLLCTSKLWFPDERANLNFKKSEELTFSLVSLTLPSKNALYDEKKNLVEFTVNERQMSQEKQFNISYKAFTDYGDELPIQVIKGKKDITNKVTVVNQKKLIQIRVPSANKFYYVKIVAEQKNNITQEFYIDYRNTIKEPISEKGENYLINLDKE